MTKIVTTEDFVERSKFIHGDKFDYSKTVYLAAKEKVTITCHKHGDFLQSPNKHLSNRGCPTCSSENKKYSEEDFIKLANNTHKGKYSYEHVNYTHSKIKVTVTCPLHGRFDQIPSLHLLGVGCPKCRNSKVGDRFRSNTEEFVERAKQVHGDKYNYDKVDYKLTGIKVIITCQIHGDFNQYPHGHLKGQGCPRCSESKGEKFIACVLDKYDIEYLREYKIPETGYKYEYDFYLPKLNILIEFQGEQHYEFNNFFHRTEEDFSNQIHRDILKRELAKKAKMRLLEVSYKHLKFMKEEQLENLIIKMINK